MEETSAPTYPVKAVSTTLISSFFEEKSHDMMKRNRISYSNRMSQSKLNQCARKHTFNKARQPDKACVPNLQRLSKISR